MKLDDVQCENIEFRKRKLQEKTDEIECIISGRVNSILPYIRTQKGEYSESKTWKFIHELTDALNEYGVKYKFWYDNAADEYMDCIPEKARETPCQKLPDFLSDYPNLLLRILRHLFLEQSM